MNTNLSQKENSLLQEQKSHEELCIKKYNDYANQAQDPQLKQLFQQLAQKEQQHLNTINQILNGQVPSMNSGQGGQQSGQQGQQGQQGGMQNQQQSGQGAQSQQVGQNMKQIQSSSATSGSFTSSNPSKQDADLCRDMLMTEKYVSHAYDTTIFECADTNVRQALNHIQKEEQQHGEDLFNYMQSNGMYNVK